MADTELGDELAARLWGGIAAFLGGVLGIGLGILLQVPWPWRFLVILASGTAAALIARWVVKTVTEGTANFLLRLIWPTGDSTPYAKVYSEEQSLAARGDIAGALKAYDAAMRLNPADPEPRFQAAELLFRSSDPTRAATLLVEARRLVGNDRARELYATQRLIDLYLGPLQQEARAYVELRRLVDRFPGTREARAARELLARLKEDARGKGKEE